MTTPRVTVPVELAERIKSFLLQAREDRKNSGKTKQALEINTMLHGLITAPATPAPEGGAVRYRHKKRGTEYTLIGVGRAQGELQDDDPVVLYRDDDGGLWVHHQVEFCDGRFEQMSALATREEAPAEAGERLTKIVNSMNLVLSGGWDEDQDCDWGAKPDEAKLDRLDDLLGDFVEALRAQPPAREDAQPVACSACRECGCNFFAHPAPDALRVAVEALEKIKAVRVCKESANIWTGADACRKIATEALADLQAEQKGGA